MAPLNLSPDHPTLAVTGVAQESTEIAMQGVHDWDAVHLLDEDKTT